MTVTCNDLLGVTLVAYRNVTLYTIIIITPPVLFLLFLLYKLRSSLQILRETTDVRVWRASLLAFLWLICLVNIARMTVQVLIPASFDLFFYSIWLGSRFMHMFVQMAVIAFILLLIVHGVPFSHVLGGLRTDRFTKRVLFQSAVSAFLLSVLDGITQVWLFFFSLLPSPPFVHKRC